MESSGTTRHVAGDLSMLMAVVTFVAMWGGVTLLLTDPHGIHLPPFAPGPRSTLTSILLFWIPTVTGALACLSGLAGLVGAGGPDARRRAVAGLLLGLTPACLAATWLGWVLVSGGR